MTSGQDFVQRSSFRIDLEANFRVVLYPAYHACIPFVFNLSCLRHTTTKGFYNFVFGESLTRAIFYSGCQ